MIQEHVEEEIVRYLSYNHRMPAILTRLITCTRNDLFCGPQYFNKYGEEVSMFDNEPGIHALDFVRACSIIHDWIAEHWPSDLYYLMDHDEVTEMWEPYEEDESTIIAFNWGDLTRLFFGNELSRYVR